MVKAMSKVYGAKHGAGVIYPFKAHSHQARVILVLSAVGVYALVFIALYPHVGLLVSAVVALPVVVAGLSLGCWAGLVTALLSVPLNTFLINLLGQPGWDAFVGSPGACHKRLSWRFLVGRSVGSVR